MTFWMGALAGLGVGGCIVFIFMLWAMTRVISGKGATDDKLYKYWEVSMDNQKQQLLILADMATSLSPDATLCSIANNEGITTDQLREDKS